MAMRQTSDEGAPAPGQAVLFSGSLGQPEYHFGSGTSKVAFGKKVITSTCVGTMTNKKQRQKVRKRVEQPKHIQGADNREVKSTWLDF